eukprot:4999210-Pyramimonas_sp.AAC.1
MLLIAAETVIPLSGIVHLASAASANFRREPRGNNTRLACPFPWQISLLHSRTLLHVALSLYPFPLSHEQKPLPHPSRRPGNPGHAPNYTSLVAPSFRIKRIVAYYL